MNAARLYYGGVNGTNIYNLLASQGPAISANMTSKMTNGFAAGPTNAIYLVYGTNATYTTPNNPPIGTTISFVVKNVFGSWTVTNSGPTVSNTVPGFGLTNNVTLGAQTRPPICGPGCGMGATGEGGILNFEF